MELFKYIKFLNESAPDEFTQVDAPIKDNTSDDDLSFSEIYQTPEDQSKGELENRTEAGFMKEFKKIHELNGIVTNNNISEVLKFINETLNIRNINDLRDKKSQTIAAIIQKFGKANSMTKALASIIKDKFEEIGLGASIQTAHGSNSIIKITTFSEEKDIFGKIKDTQLPKVKDVLIKLSNENQNFQISPDFKYDYTYGLLATDAKYNGKQIKILIRSADDRNNKSTADKIENALSNLGPKNKKFVPGKVKAS